MAPETGFVNGKVLDDELLPLANASVTLVELNVNILTGPTGTFEFLNVPVGRHLIAADKPGYASQGVKVDVTAGATITRNFQLVPLAGNQAFVEVLSHSLLHNYEASMVTWTVGYYSAVLNQSELTAVCTGCRWTWATVEKAETIVVEILGRHSVPDPVYGNMEAFYFYGNKTIATETTIFGTSVALPSNQVFGPTAVSKYHEFLTLFFCHYYWVCVQEGRDVWVSIFHGAPSPEGYTALPKH
jgi:hypothetical protein